MSFAVLDRLAREAGRDQALADGLWATGNYDARILACRVRMAKGASAVARG